MELVKFDKCPKCKEKKRAVYNNKTAYCEWCDSHFDLGMKPPLI